MFLNAVIFKKLDNLFQQMTSNSSQYYLTFSPFPVVFSNYDFNFLDPRLPADQLSDSYENKMAFAYFANAIVRNPKIQDVNVEDFLQNSYKKILDSALLIEASLSDEDKAAYKAARQVLFLNDNLDPTPAYQKYQEYKSRYSAITDELAALATRLMDHPDDAEARSRQQALQQKMNVVFNDWVMEGDKENVEKAEKAVFHASRESEFTAQWRSEALALKSLPPVTTVNSDMEFVPVFCLPNDLNQYAYHGWQKIVLEEAEISQLSGDARSHLGESLYQQFDDGSSQVTRIEFEYLYVTLLRNWFKPDLVNSRFYRFPDDSADIVSDGSELTKGLLPSYIDKFIFIRRVSTVCREDPQGRAPSVPDLNLKAYQFRQMAGIKKVREIKAVTPVATPATRFRVLTADNQVMTPVLMRQPAAARMILMSERKPAPAAAPAAEVKVAPGVLRRMFIRRPVVANVVTPVTPPPKTEFNLSLRCKDHLGNPSGGITVTLANSGKDVTLARDTDDEGRVAFPDLKKDSYQVAVRNEELYEDFDLTLQLDQDTDREVTLQKRENPRFDMFLIGAVNYRFPKLPDPLPGYQYD